MSNLRLTIRPTCIALMIFVFLKKVVLLEKKLSLGEHLESSMSRKELLNVGYCLLQNA